LVQEKTPCRWAGRGGKRVGEGEGETRESVRCEWKWVEFWVDGEEEGHGRRGKVEV